jgi:hypothetical protein
MKKLVQLSSRSNNPPTFLIQVFGKFRIEDEYRLKSFSIKILFWGILQLASSNSQEVHNRNFLGLKFKN